ncbi:MAG: hypothetical protein K6F68_08365 [Clostridiales bacterium]|nr:hypothetical protein [Clostridiales bacterium]
MIRKSIPFYVGVWGISLALFAILCFVIPSLIPGLNATWGVSFWVPFALILLAFAVNLVCAVFTLKAENASRTFYRIPLLRISWISLIVISVCALIFRILPAGLMWAAAVLCVIVCVISAAALLKAGAAAVVAEAVDNRVADETAFIRDVTLRLEGIARCAKDEETRRICNAVYEAARYSDPRSSAALSDIEAQIDTVAASFEKAVADNDGDGIKKAGDELLGLFSRRGSQCKRMK